MPRVLVPVRYPLTKHSRSTLAEAARIARDRAAQLTVLHVNLYQSGRTVSRRELARAVRAVVDGELDPRCIVRSGFLVEETIFEEAVDEGVDVVVIGRKQVGPWRRMINRIVDDPDVERYLREELDCEIVTVDVS